jgi:hypothetical protein
LKRSALLIALLMAPIHAATPPDSEPSERFECDASGDSEPPVWKKELTAFPAYVSGTFEMLELKSHRQWPPMVQVYIDNPDSHSKGFSINWLPEESGGPTIRWFPTWQTAARALESAPWRATGVIPFDLAVSADGQVRLRVSDVVHAAWVDVTKPLTIQLTCITAKVHFDSIRVRSVSPNTSLERTRER